MGRIGNKSKKNFKGELRTKLRIVISGDSKD
jgi:hypothetical protein